ncbi:MAG: CBS domain-containing protein [Chloroflexi bacterium]|nr:CBS domain-containing protein [Chloroflexota bacterium]
MHGLQPHEQPSGNGSPCDGRQDAARLMVEKNVKRLPVVENGKLVGLISFSDIALAMDQPVHNLLIGMGAARKAAA